MNVMKIYTMKDQKIEAYLQPFYAVNDATAIRMVEMSLDDGQSMISRNPEDFTLWVIGEWSVLTGEITPQVGVCVCKAHDLIRPDKGEQ